jgi:hypothetical protein
MYGYWKAIAVHFREILDKKIKEAEEKAAKSADRNKYIQEQTLACFVTDNMKGLDPWVEWYYALHWLPKNQEFLVSNSRTLTARCYQTEKAVIGNYAPLRS